MSQSYGVSLLLAGLILAGPLSLRAAAQQPAATPQPTTPATPQLSPEVQAKLRSYEFFLRRLDANLNRVIEPREIPISRLESYKRVAQRLGMDPAQPISMESFRRAIVNHYQPGAAVPTAPLQTTPSTPDSAAPTAGGTPTPAVSAGTVPGFGEETEETPPPGFGKETEKTSAVSAASPSGRYQRHSGHESRGSSRHDSSGGSTAGADAETQAKYRKYADAMVRQYDESKNGVLERAEWSKMKPFYHAADRNRDSVITRDELMYALLDYNKKKEESSGSSSSSSSGGDSRHHRSGSRSDHDDRKPTIRFRTPIERLPDGLPAWFTAKDSNRDGQVAMSEYGVEEGSSEDSSEKAPREWDAEKLARFKHFDKNHDGVITPAECLAGEKEE